jgi:hypothetical protein
VLPFCFFQSGQIYQLSGQLIFIQLIMGFREGCKVRASDVLHA